jgi:hypothetical protein
MHKAMLLAVALGLGACATPSPETSGGETPPGWHPVRLPGKQATAYRWVHKDGASAVHAQADASASMLRRPVVRAPDTLGEIEFAWLVTRLPRQGNVAQAEQEDASARVILAFDGDEARLSTRNRALFDLARALTGESPPYATLMYVWDEQAPVGTVVVNPRSDRIRKIVVESGASGLGQWRRYRRNVIDDYRRAFEEAPGPLKAIGLMTDADNTRSSLSTWYRDVILH